MKLQGGVGVKSYQISGALHLRLSILEEEEEPKLFKQTYLLTVNIKGVILNSFPGSY